MTFYFLLMTIVIKCADKFTDVARETNKGLKAAYKSGELQLGGENEWLKGGQQAGAQSGHTALQAY